MRARLPLLRHFSKLISLVTTVAALSAMAAAPCLAEEKKLSLYLPVPGPSPAGNIRVQLTTFKVPGHSLPLSLLETSMADDEALFLRLAGMAAEGSAEITADQHFTVPAGKESDQRINRDQPFVDNFLPGHDGLAAFPANLQHRTNGLNAGMEFIVRSGELPGGPEPMITGVLHLENRSTGGFVSWPLRPPGRPEGNGIISQPEFFDERTSVLLKTADAAHHLLSVVRCAPVVETGGQEAYSWTWAKAVPEFYNPSSVVRPGTALRLHLLTFELPLAAGRALLRSQRSGTDDTRLLAALLKSGPDDDVTLHRQAVLRIESVSGVSDGSLKSADSLPGNRRDWLVDSNPQQSKTAPPPPPAVSASGSLEFIQESLFPMDFSGELMPESFDGKNTGVTFEAAAVKISNAGDIDLRIALQDNSSPDIFSWLESGPHRVPGISMPAQSKVELEARLQVRPGGVYCVGAVTLPEFFKNQIREQPMMRIHLIKVSGGRSGSASPAAGYSPRGFVSEVLSLSPEDASQLQSVAVSPAEAEPLLDQLLDTGAARPLSWCWIAGTAESSPAILAEVETPTPYSCGYGPARILHPGNFHFLTLGHCLRFNQRPGYPPLQFRHGNATISQPGEAELMQAADHGAKAFNSGDSGNQPTGNPSLGPNDLKPSEGALPEPERFEIDVATDIPPIAPFQILSLAPAHVPAGHPEEGRWHAAILRTAGR